MVARADVLLVDRYPARSFRRAMATIPHLDQLIQVDIDPTNLSKATLGIVGDAGAVLEQLTHETRARSTPTTG